MADNNHNVTIDESRLFELLQIEKRTQEHAEYLADRKSKACVICPVVRERDELKAKLDYAERENNKYRAMPTEYKHCKDRLAEAERCILDIEGILEGVEDGALSTDNIKDIIRAYREEK